MDNYLTKEDLATMLHVPYSEVDCMHCRMSNKETFNFDHKTCYCMYFRTSTPLTAFCSHYSKNCDIKELLEKAEKGA